MKRRKIPAKVHPMKVSTFLTYKRRGRRKSLFIHQRVASPIPMTRYRILAAFTKLLLRHYETWNTIRLSVRIDAILCVELRRVGNADEATIANDRFSDELSVL